MELTLPHMTPSVVSGGGTSQARQSFSTNMLPTPLSISPHPAIYHPRRASPSRPTCYPIGPMSSTRSRASRGASLHSRGKWASTRLWWRGRGRSRSAQASTTLTLTLTLNPDPYPNPAPHPTPTPNPSQVNSVFYKNFDDQYRAHCDGECHGGRYRQGQRIASSLTYCQVAATLLCRKGVQPCVVKVAAQGGYTLTPTLAGGGAGRLRPNPNPCRWRRRAATP